jgi:hypothetical protein
MKEQKEKPLKFTEAKNLPQKTHLTGGDQNLR